MKFQGLILAAGDSKRLSSLTKDMPKSFLEISNKKIIYYHLEYFSSIGLKHVTIVVGYLADLFTKTIGSEYRGMQITYILNENYSDCNHGWSLHLANEKCNEINQAVIIAHADTFYDFRLLEVLVNSDFENTILVDRDFKIKTNDELLVFGTSGIVNNLLFPKERKTDCVGEFLGLQTLSINSLNSFYKFSERYFSEKGKTTGYDRMLGDFINESEIEFNYKEINNIAWININHEDDYFYAKKIGSFIEPYNFQRSRQKKLKNLINSKGIVRILEAHNGLTGLIVEKCEVDGNSFDGMWLSSLTHSASKGKPDIQYVDVTTISQTLGEIFDVTTKPIIVDVDNGGLIEHFKFTVKSLDRLGVSAIIIEDKVGSKENSLFDDTSTQQQDSIENFCYKITEGKKSQLSGDIMIIARIESFILGKGLDDAIKRAKAYLKAGVDGIMIHSKSKTTDEIKAFCSEFRKQYSSVPLVVVPTTYSQIKESKLKSLGVNVVIYANHLLRAAYPAMQKTAISILKHERSLETSEEDCMPVKEIITLIPSSSES